MKQGLLERIYHDFENKCFPDCWKHPELKDQAGIVRIDYIVELARELQRNEYDVHINISGQNGNGKSMFMLELMKKLSPDSIKNGQILYAFDKHSTFIKSLAELKRTALGIDELGVFFNYKQSMTTEQIVLFNMIEIARKNGVAVISCARDPRRINNNYRNGKISVVIWLIDRMEKGDTKSYGLVFVGNPVLEDDDKFHLNAFNNINTFEEMRLTAESLPTFFGYIFIDDVLNHISKEELDIYTENKDRGMKEVYQKHIRSLNLKENPMERTNAEGDMHKRNWNFGKRRGETDGTED
jgi:ABC-type dipeptide/oligopeptide/nickel transport system ATPase component